MPLSDAELHALGRTQFTDDLIPPEGLLFVYPICAAIAHGLIETLELEAALAYPGVVAIFTAADIPGLNQVSNVSTDEVLLAEEEVVYQGSQLPW